MTVLLQHKKPTAEESIVDYEVSSYTYSNTDTSCSLSSR